MRAIREHAAAFQARAEAMADQAADAAMEQADLATQKAVQAGRDAMERARCEADNAQQILDSAAESAMAAAEAAGDALEDGANIAMDVLEDGFVSNEDKIAMYFASRPVPRGPFAVYIRLGDLAYTLTTSTPFEFAVYFFITVSCLYAGASTYDELADEAWMANLDIALAIIFLTETAVKIVAEGTRPWKFFYGNPYWGWNCFDFTSTRTLVLNTTAFCVRSHHVSLRLQSMPSRCHGSPMMSPMLSGKSGVSLVS
jgi:hypothetical protein